MCIHRLPDGTPCCAPAVARSTRCRHHQLDLRRRERVAHAAAATRAYHRLVVSAHGRELLATPFADAIRQLSKLRDLGFIAASHARSMRYGLQLIAQIQNQGAGVRGQRTGKNECSFVIPTLSEVEGEESAVETQGPSTSLGMTQEECRSLVASTSG